MFNRVQCGRAHDFRTSPSPGKNYLAATVNMLTEISRNTTANAWKVPNGHWSAKSWRDFDSCPHSNGTDSCWDSPNFLQKKIRKAPRAQKRVLCIYQRPPWWFLEVRIMDQSNLCFRVFGLEYFSTCPCLLNPSATYFCVPSFFFFFLFPRLRYVFFASLVANECSNVGRCCMLVI